MKALPSVIRSIPGGCFICHSEAAAEESSQAPDAEKFPRLVILRPQPKNLVDQYCLPEFPPRHTTLRLSPATSGSSTQSAPSSFGASNPLFASLVQLPRRYPSLIQSKRADRAYIVR